MALVPGARGVNRGDRANSVTVQHHNCLTVTTDWRHICQRSILSSDTLHYQSCNMVHPNFASLTQSPMVAAASLCSPMAVFHPRGFFGGFAPSAQLLIPHINLWRVDHSPTTGIYVLHPICTLGGEKG